MLVQNLLQLNHVFMVEIVFFHSTAWKFKKTCEIAC